LKWWRSQIGLVQQEPFLFNDTIFTNVANGLIGSQWEKESEEKKRELVKEACKEAFADEFIDKLPDVSHVPAMSRESANGCYRATTQLWATEAPSYLVANARGLPLLDRLFASRRS